MGGLVDGEEGEGEQGEDEEEEDEEQEQGNKEFGGGGMAVKDLGDEVFLTILLRILMFVILNPLIIYIISILHLHPTHLLITNLPTYPFP